MNDYAPKLLGSLELPIPVSRFERCDSSDVELAANLDSRGGW